MARGRDGRAPHGGPGAVQARPWGHVTTLPGRTRAAVAVGRAVARASRLAGAGEGSVIGGRATLVVDGAALRRLAAGKAVALVSGTNGKTTTTRLLTAALATRHPVVSNTQGANLLPGLVGALSARPHASAAALEVDEGVLRHAVTDAQPRVVALLNLSRDQLDRIGEVRLHAASWAEALRTAPGATAVANADDPLVVWAARNAAAVTWVGTGQRWMADAASCPACAARIARETSGGDDGPGRDAGPSWWCTGCDLRRPTADVELAASAVVMGGGQRVPLDLALPGRCNQANAAVATAAAFALEPTLDPHAVAAALGEVRTVEGRYEVRRTGGRSVRLLLAKNPAGWAEALDLVRPAPVGLVIGINARVADGRDPSWLWDVEFERLAARRVIATGDRGRDLAVRLRYAGVEHAFVEGYPAAVAAPDSADVDLLANYTSFQDARRAL